MPRDQNRRAAFAGLAATGSLLAATAAAALVVGGLLGFGAFPGAADQRATAPLRVAPAPAGATARAPIVLARATPGRHCPPSPPPPMPRARRAPARPIRPRPMAARSHRRSRRRATRARSHRARWRP